MSTDYGPFVNGAFRFSGSPREIIDPSDQQVIARVATATDQDIEDALSGARRAFDDGPWRRMPLSERAGCLSRIAEGILEKAAELAQLETRNTGKPIKETTFMDIPSSARSFSYLAAHLEELLADQHTVVSDPFKASSLLRREPYGIAMLIVPWNYPLLIACWKLASALAAGNTVVLKPASITPLSVLELASIIKQAGVPDGVVQIVTGRGPEVGQRLCEDSRLDMISFTGSNQVGKQIIGYTSGSVKKMIMELGGKSASIICRDADLEAAVNGALCSIFLNQGQMCTAMSRMYIEEAVYEPFVRDFTAKAQRIKLGKAADFQTQMGPLISEQHRAAVAGFLDQARSQRVRFLCGGNIPQDASLRDGFFFEPTVLEGVTEHVEIFSREVFGPVAAVTSCKDSQEALRLANATEYALAGSVWSKDLGRAQEIASGMDAGTVWINTYGMFLSELPYGGFKQSGFGKELGKEGLWEYTRLKNVITDASDDGKPLVNYWYGL